MKTKFINRKTMLKYKRQAKKSFVIPKAWKTVPMWPLVVALGIIVFAFSYTFTHLPQKELHIPIWRVSHTIVKPVIAKELTEEDQIEYFIRETFKDDADKALKLLTCENKKLNPKAVHVNDDGTKDLGIFQVNNHWWGFKHEVLNEQMLFDWKINTLIAYQIYLRNDKSFDRWACNWILK